MEQTQKRLIRIICHVTKVGRCARRLRIKMMTEALMAVRAEQSTRMETKMFVALCILCRPASIEAWSYSHRLVI